MSHPDPQAARILSSHGRTAWVLPSSDQGLAPASGPAGCLCQFKGRDLAPVANDFVRIDRSASPPTLLEILPRTNQLMRQEAGRTKVIAANLDLVLILVAGHPGFSPEIVLRVIASLLADGIPFLILANKWDREEDHDKTLQLLDLVQPIEPASRWPVIRVSCAQPDGLDLLMAALERLQLGPDACIALAGQSGMGKSSLLNRLVPQAQAEIQAVSAALHSGKHTTTASRVYRWQPESSSIAEQVRPGAWIVDTPGFQQFGIGHLSRAGLAAAFPDWPALAQAAGRSCRFSDCRHDEEPGCVVREGTEADPSGRGEARRQIWRALLAHQASQLPR